MNSMSDEERDQLIDALLEGDISEADFVRLEAEMIVDEAARQAYYNRQKLQTGLVLDAEEYHSGASTDTSAIGGRQRSFRFDGLTISAAAVLAIVVGLIGWKIGQDSERARITRTGEAVVSGFGVVAGPVGGTWTGSKLREGDLVPGGELTLESGIAAVELFSGVELLIQGPARFEVLSGMEVKLTSGSAQIRVPGVAKGFQITTPSGKIVTDEGEFSLQIEGNAELVQVVVGFVSWNSGDSQNSLVAGEGMRRSGDGGFSPAIESPETMDETEARLAASREIRRSEWESRSVGLQEDPRLLLYLSAAEANRSKSVLPDLSPAKNNGTIVRAERTADRWGQADGAIDFSPTGSRVRVDVGGEHESLTLMCWVKIDGLDRWYNSLFLTDGHELHEPHWQIMDDGRLFFSVRAREAKGKPDKFIAYSPPVWTPAQSGQWMHLATVYNGESSTIAHYVNGEVVSIETIPEALRPDKVVIGPASVGNWSEPRYRTDAGFTMRNLNGAIDEFLLFSAPLSAGEIEELYEAGMP